MDKLIFALDVPSASAAYRLITLLQPEVKFFKVGLELIAAGAHVRVIDYLKERGLKCFLDIKLLDIPQTVHNSIAVISKLNVDLVSVHADKEALAAAQEAAEGNTEVVAITLLTSKKDDTLFNEGYRMSAMDMVQLRTRFAVETGCAGVVCSAWENIDIRFQYQDKLKIINPGIRLTKNFDDQKRVQDPIGAIRSGADHIVVGREIRDAGDPLFVANQINQQINGA